MSAADPASPAAAIRVMRLIGSALAGGVTIFAAVAWLLQQDGPAETTLLLYLWIAVTTTMAAAAMIIWRGQVVPHLEKPVGSADWRERAVRIQTGLVITWAVIETAAMLGVVVYFIDGHALAGAGGVVLMWAALALTWPREEWLQPDRLAR